MNSKYELVTNKKIHSVKNKDFMENLENAVLLSLLQQQIITNTQYERCLKNLNHTHSYIPKDGD